MLSQETIQAIYQIKIDALRTMFINMSMDELVETRDMISKEITKRKKFAKQGKNIVNKAI